MGTEIDRLEILVEAEAKKANAELDKLIGKLNKVSSSLTATNTSGLRNFANGINLLSKSMQTMSGVKTSDFTRLANGIQKLSNINQSSLYKSGNAIRNFTNSINSIQASGNVDKLKDIANGVSRLGGASVNKAITTLPHLSAALKSFMVTLSSAPNVSQNIIQMTNAMAALASNGAKFGSTIGGMSRASQTLSRRLNSASVATNTYSKSNVSARLSAISLTATIGKLAAAYYTIKRAVDFVGNSITSSMDFGETINLFQTSFKKIGMEAAQESGLAWGSDAANQFAIGFINEAQDFNDKLTDALSLDPNTIMNYQAIFAQMANAFGLTNQSVMNLSESFTMLGLDIASLFNIDVEDAMVKLRSGLAGETEPLRALGVDITEATLKMTAMKYGIDESVSSMSYASKTQLRWLAIMDQTEVAFGDMAKTIDSPANQIRILHQQWNNLSRSLGNIFLPVVSAVLPYINAVTIAIRQMMDTMATAMGYDLPDYSDSNIYKDATSGLEGVEDAANDATKANEKLKKSLYSGDELNILSDNSASNAGKTGSGYSQLDDAIQQKTDSYMAKFNEQLQNMSGKSELLAKNIESFFKSISNKTEPATKSLKNLWDNGLKNLVGFTGQAFIDFYNEFLSPVGDWMFGEDSGLGKLANTINDDLMSLDWDTFNKNLKDFWRAIAPYAENFGEGLIDFFSDIADISLIAINGVLGKGGTLDTLIGILDLGNPESAKEWGRVFASLATSILLFKVGSSAGLALTALVSNLSTLVAIGTIAVVIDVTTRFIGDAKKWWDYIQKYGWDDGRKKIADENPANPYKNGTAADLSTEARQEMANSNPANPYNNGTATSSEDLITGWENITNWSYENGGVLGMFSEKGQDILDAIKKGINDGMADFGEWLGGLPAKMAGEMGSLSANFVSKGGQILSGIKSGWLNGWEDFKAWIIERPGKIAYWFGSLKDNFLAKGGQIISGIKQGWTDGLEDFKAWLSGIPSQIANGIGSLFDIGKNMIQSLINGFQSLTLPTITYSGGVTSKGYSHSTSIGGFATGGYPSPGQLFVANEPGNPELVGNIGGKTAVANGGQIEAGIEEAAYRGYMRAIMESGGGSNGSITIENKMYLEDDVVYRSYNRAKQSNGNRFNPVMQPS